MGDFRVTFDFDGQGDSELSVAAGTIVKPLVTQDVNGWILCKRSDNLEEGYIPASYLEPLQQTNKTENQMGDVKPTISNNPFDVVDDQNINQVTNRMTSMKFQSLESTSSLLSGAEATRNSFGPVAAPHEAQSETFRSVLDFWRERERRFIEGEQERLPAAKPREYYYWDRKGVRHGPLSETEMKAKFDKRQLATDTPVKVSLGGNVLPQRTIEDYFPNVELAFIMAPHVPNSSITLWCYIDDASMEQGPFDSNQMRSWFNDGYFAADTMVKNLDRPYEGYVTLGSLFPHGTGAFLPDSSNQTALYSQGSNLQPNIASGRTNSPIASNSMNMRHSTPFPSASSSMDKPHSTSFPSASNSMGKPHITSFPSASNMNVATAEALGSNSVNPFRPRLGHSPSGKNLLALVLSDGEKPEDAAAIPMAVQAPVPLASDWDISWDVADEGDAKDGEAQHASTEKEAQQPQEVGLIPKQSKVKRTIRRKSSMKPDSIANPANVVDCKVLINKYLSNVRELYQFLTRPLSPEMGVVRFRIRRSSIGVNLKFNVFELCIEDLDQDRGIGPVILQATRHTKFGLDAYYQFAFGYSVPNESGTVIAQMLHNSILGAFILHNDVKQHTGKSKDLCAIAYTKSGGNGPREMKIGIPGPLASKSGTEKVTVWPHGGTTKKSKLLHALSAYNFAGITPLVNKKPSWSEKHGAYTLNFHRRVNRASVKNFQLAPLNDQNHVCLLHGRSDDDLFVMDVRAPLSPLAAFAICVSSHMYR